MNVDEIQKEKREGQIGNECGIYVGDLPGTIQDEELYKLFKSVGDIYSVVLTKKEGRDGRVGAHAQILFFNQVSVKKAIEMFNYHALHGVQIRVMPLMSKDTIYSKSKEGNLIVKGLPKDMDKQTLNDTFSIFGKILSCKVHTTLSGECTGIGFVQFERPEVAAASREIINQSTLKGHKLSAEKWVASSERVTKKEEINHIFTNVYIKHVPTCLSEEAVRAEIEKLGTLTSFLAQKTPEGRLTGVVFANFSTHEEAVRAIETLHHRAFPGREGVSGEVPLYAHRVIPKSEREPVIFKKYEEEKQSGTNSIYVINLPISASNEEIQEYFAVAGKIVSMNIIREEESKRSFGYINYENAEQSKEAIEKTNEKKFKGNVLSVAYARGKKHREIEKLTQHQGYGNYHPASGYIKGLHKTARQEAPPDFGVELYGLILSLAPSYREKIEQAGFRTHEEFAKKITGMILELDSDEVKKASKLGNVLSGYVEESLDVIIRRAEE